MIQLGSALCMVSGLLSLILWFAGEAGSEPGLHGIELVTHVIDMEVSIPLSGIVGSASARDTPRLAAVLILVSAVAGRLILDGVYSVAGPLMVVGAVTILIAADIRSGKH